MQKNGNGRPYIGIVLFSVALILIIRFLTYTSEDVRWGTGFWEQWLANHAHCSLYVAHQAVFWARKLIHFVSYGGLGLLFWWYFHLWRLPRAMLFGLGATALVAVYDEYAQSRTNFRFGKPEDVLLDVCGAVMIGLMARWALRGRRS